ncbi:MAG: putative polysaccharide biosynthesis protein [Bacillota bacterium]
MSLVKKPEHPAITTEQNTPARPLQLAGQTLIKGALILTLAGLLVRVLGAVYRIPLGRLLGDEGLGLYAIPNQYYLLFFTISAAGIPVGVSRLVAAKVTVGAWRDAYRTFQITLLTMLGLGLGFSLLLYCGAPFLVRVGLVANPAALAGMRAIAPVVFFAAVTAAFRGLFQGLQNMTAVALSQVVDQTLLVVGTLLFSYLLLPRGLAAAAAGANFGAVPGAVAATLFMLLVFLRYRSQFRQAVALDSSGSRESAWQLLKKVFTVSIPISFANVSMALTGIIDNKLIIERLQLTGYTQQQATALYGQLNQMALSFINISIAFSFSLGTSLVPAVSRAHAAGDHSAVRSQLRAALRLSLLTSLPATAGLLVLAPQLTDLLFANSAAGTPLRYLAPAVLFWGLHLVLSGTLQGLGRADLPVRNLLTGIGLKIALTWGLTPTPLGIRAAALATTAMFALAGALNVLSLRRLVGLEFRPRQDLLPAAAASALMAAAVWTAYRALLLWTGHSYPATALAIGCGLLTYPPLLYALGGITPSDLSRLPGPGRRLAGWLAAKTKTY